MTKLNRYSDRHFNFNIMEDLSSRWKGIYLSGAIFSLFVIFGIISDITFGIITGGNLTALPMSAAGRFSQLQQNPLLGLYNLDLLNVVIQILSIPVMFAVYAALRRVSKASATLALVIFLTGSIIYICGNNALAMFDLSEKYFAASNAQQKLLYEAAGEALLVKGVHGGSALFIGTFIPVLANLLFSISMKNGKVFSKTTAVMGIIGNILLGLYVVLITFLPDAGQFALVLAMPGGILVLVWIIMFTVNLFRIKFRLVKHD